MIFRAENISKTYSRKVVLRNISFTMEKGLLYGVVGENGSGKSTLLRIIAGECRADAGKLTVNGKLGYCPQEMILFPQLTVNEHFRYFAAAYNISNEASLLRSDELMDHFGFGEYRDDKVSTLSGGTKQKLNLSIALLSSPDLLILDEPYNGFDWDTYIKFWDYTDILLRNECSILIVAHLLSEKERFSRIFTIGKGNLI
jgi:ABC-type multidrug transport system ATPase subunit